jgi:hypothetical protein
LFALKPTLALAELKADPLNASPAEAKLTPEPRDQFPKVTPDGGVVQVAVGVAGEVTVPPPPTVTVVVCACAAAIHPAARRVMRTERKFNPKRKDDGIWEGAHEDSSNPPSHALLNFDTAILINCYEILISLEKFCYFWMTILRIS